MIQEIFTSVSWCCVPRFYPFSAEIRTTLQRSITLQLPFLGPQASITTFTKYFFKLNDSVWVNRILHSKQIASPLFQLLLGVPDEMICYLLPCLWMRPSSSFQCLFCDSVLPFRWTTPRWPVMFCVWQKRVTINSSLMAVTIFIYFNIEITVGYVICCYWSSRHWKYESEVDKDTSYWDSPTDRKTDCQDELNLVQLTKLNKGLREAYFEGWGNFLFAYIFFVSFFLKIITCPVVLGNIYVFWSVDNFWRIIIENEKGSLRCPSWISSF